MSYAASLPGPQRGKALAAFAAFGALLNEALDDQAETARAHGTRAVAEAAYVPGGRSPEEIEAVYLGLLAEAVRDTAQGRHRAA